MISVPVQVGVELGSGVAVLVGKGVEEAVAVSSVALGVGVSNIGEGITQAAITTSPMTGAIIHGFRLRTGLGLSGVKLNFTFSTSIRG